MREHESVFACEETVEDIRLIRRSLWRVSLIGYPFFSFWKALLIIMPVNILYVTFCWL